MGYMMQPSAASKLVLCGYSLLTENPIKPLTHFARQSSNALKSAKQDIFEAPVDTNRNNYVVGSFTDTARNIPHTHYALSMCQNSNSNWDFGFSSGLPTIKNVVKLLHGVSLVAC